MSQSMIDAFNAKQEQLRKQILKNPGETAFNTYLLYATGKTGLVLARTFTPRFNDIKVLNGVTDEYIKSLLSVKDLLKETESTVRTSIHENFHYDAYYSSRFNLNRVSINVDVPLKTLQEKPFDLSTQKLKHTKTWHNLHIISERSTLCMYTSRYGLLSSAVILSILYANKEGYFSDIKQFCKTF